MFKGLGGLSSDCLGKRLAVKGFYGLGEAGKAKAKKVQET